ncbi:MAG: hypothetical protein PHQ59_01360 [Candidatus Daviesbacteria bacterium]|nr:hypothetical protein [Candidatus Daviesbacteria bacterium]
MNQKGFVPIIIILGIVLFLTIVGGAYYFGRMTIKGKILDYNSMPFDNPNLEIKGINGSFGKCEVKKTGNFICKALLLPNQTYGIYLNDDKTNAFVLQHFTAEFAKIVDIGERQVPRTSEPQATSIDETADWKTYTNTKYGYLIKYPEKLKIRERGSLSPSLIDSLDICLKESCGDPDIISVNVITKEFALGSLNNPSISKEEITISNIKGIKKVGEYHYGKEIIVYFPAPNGASYVNIGTNSQNAQIFDTILSTFKFTDTNSGSGKYTCPENGYQNCMPILDAEGQKQCSKEALDWKQTNCPNFSGAAY